jgi:hypothetical protein
MRVWILRYRKAKWKFRFFRAPVMNLARILARALDYADYGIAARYRWSSAATNRGGELTSFHVVTTSRYLVSSRYPV